MSDREPEARPEAESAPAPVPPDVPPDVPEDSPAERDRRARRRPLWIVVCLLLLGAVALWGASAMTWVRGADGRPSSTAALTGGQAAPALVPLALLCAAAIAAVVALGGWVRRLLGVVVLGAGAATAAVTLGAEGALAARGVALLGALLVLGAGGLLVVRGAAMPKLGGGYQTPGAAKRSADPDRELWNALERGDDPTEGD
ncbi:Trp biosynthesis-associated membrane protein [Saccharothrix coeruleofusca]|uniref:Tryptophan-associated transmembrane protein n=1 Tax=Saccharothrix coeruleofusca TaxID=33919 RepID=A0A918AK81_9PSEU|nr:Trp biosynthesis-associated membrane protein [Saccharothrix coeruleofusca]GGP49327.1 hypothetical protein GCM10010185_21880 [Saccharothrix coeruleofusca]